MRTTLHRRRDGTHYSFHTNRGGGRGRRQTSRATPDRRRRAFSRAVRDDRRDAHAFGRRAQARRRARGRRSGWTSAGTGWRRRLRHQRGRPRGARDGEGGRAGAYCPSRRITIKPTPEGLYQHFKAIADATPLPIVLYNVPGRTGCNIDAATCARLATIPTIVGVKEASGNIQQMAEVCRVGAGGFPRAVGRRRGDVAADGDGRPRHHLGGLQRNPGRDVAARRSGGARRLSRPRERFTSKILPLMLGNFIESNPGPVKFAMAAMGLCEEVFRLPMVSPRPASKEKMLRF